MFEHLPNQYAEINCSTICKLVTFRHYFPYARHEKRFLQRNSFNMQNWSRAKRANLVDFSLITRFYCVYDLRCVSILLTKL